MAKSTAAHVGDREVSYSTAEAIINDFIDAQMPGLKPAEIKLALVILRGSIGRGKLSASLDRRELQKRTKLDKDTLRRTIRPLCGRLGIGIQRDGRRKFGVASASLYTWPWPPNEQATAKDEAEEG